MDRPLRKDAQRNRDLLVQAGREVFAERGLEASLDDVARHAGVGVGTAYRHFANKYDLARAIFENKIAHFESVVQTALADPDPWDGIVYFLETAAAEQAADRGLREALTGVHDEGQMELVHERLADLLGRLVDRAKDAGKIRADASASDIGMVVLMACTVADVGGDLAPDLWRRYLPMLLDGLRPGPPLAVEAMSEPDMRKAMLTLMRRRNGQPAPSPVPK